MIKHSLLATSIAMALVQQAAAAPLLPIDARGLAMGGTGVASAKLAHAPQYNPALLSTANQEDDFAIIFPQIGLIAADEDKFIDTLDGLTDEDYATTASGESESLIDHFSTIANELTDNLSALETDISNLKGSLTGDLKTATSAEIAAIKLQTTALEAGLTGFTNNTQDLKNTTFDLTSELDKLSGSGLRLGGGVNGAIAIPSKVFAAALTVNANIFASAKTIFTPEDQNLINAYAEGVNEYASLTNDYISATNDLIDAIENFNTDSTVSNGALVDLKQTDVSDKQDLLNEYKKNVNGNDIISVVSGNITVDENPVLNSQVQVIAIGITEIGLTLSREFSIAGKSIAIGITPKLQTIKTYNFIASVEDEDIDEEDVTDTEQNFSDFNLDAGAAYQFGSSNQWQVGLVAKNLLSKEYKSESNAYGPTGSEQTSTTTISLDTQFRGGISHTTDWTVVAIDIDLMENDPIAFENPTQYASIGAELDIFDTLQLRAGYRTNLSASDSAMASVGLGLSPFGVHLDIAAMANPSDPEKEVGAAIELGFYF